MKPVAILMMPILIAVYVLKGVGIHGSEKEAVPEIVERAMEGMVNQMFI
jgi:hypothetical protein